MNEARTPSSSGFSPTQPVERFPSLSALRAAHAELLQEYRAATEANGDAPGVDVGSTPDSPLQASIQAFIQRGQATGALLDIEEDRGAVQSLLDYWSAILYRAGLSAPDATLADFDETLAPELPDDLCPYVGLYAFQEGDDAVFFGRQDLVNDAMTRLTEGVRLLATVGPSGSGKSSLVLAGILPRLKTGALPDSETWRYLPRLTPGSNPLRNLARLFLPALSPPDSQENVAWLEERVAQMQADDSTLLALVSEGGPEPTLLIVDQFEEIFTLCTDETQRMAFAQNVRVLVETPGVDHRVLLTLRTDFEPQVARLGDFQPLFEENVLRVTPLSAAQLRNAIEKPAALIGLKFEQGLVDALLQDILGEPAALPLLQFTLLKLWEARERNRITWDAYQRLGGGRMALANSADRLYNSLIPEEQFTLRRILMRLVRPSEGLEITSSRMRVATLRQSGEARDRVDRVLQRLIDERLLRVSGMEIANGAQGEIPDDAQVEIAHEALVRNWPRLVSWLEDERESIRQRVRLTEAAQQWESLGRDPSALLRGTVLDEALRRTDLNERERAFVAASVDVRDAEERAREAARQHELEQARALAQAERQSAQRWRNLVIVLAATIILMVLAALIIRRQRQQIDTAQTQAAVAEEQAAVAVTAAVAAEAEATAAATAVAVATSVNYLEQGVTLAEQGNYNAAIQAFDQAIAAAPGNATAYLGRGNAYFAMGDYDQAIADYTAAISRNPESATGYYRRGLAYSALENYPAAVADFTRAIELNPKDANAYLQRGLANVELGNLEAAQADFTMAIELFVGQDVKQAESYRARARAYDSQMNYEAATQDLERALELQPDNIQIYTELAQVSADQENMQVAADYLKRALKIDPSNPNLYRQVGQIEIRLGELEAAIAHLNQAMELAPGTPGILVDLGDAYVKAGEFMQAVEEYTAALRDGAQPRSTIYNKRGQSKAQAGEYLAAIDDFSQAIALDDTLTIAYMNRGDAYRQLEDRAAAIDDYERAVELQPDSPAILQRRAAFFESMALYDRAVADWSSVLALGDATAEPYAERARVQMLAGAYAEAAQDYVRALDLAPDDIDLQIGLARALDAQGESQQAIQIFGELLQQEPDRGDIHFYRGNARYSLGDYEAAIADYTDAIERGEGTSATYFNRGSAYYALKEFAAAIADYERAIELNPTMSDAYLYRGHAYYALGLQNLGRAFEGYSQAIELEPDLEIFIEPENDGD